MTRMRIIALAITMLMLGTNAFGDDISPNEILKKVAATYKSMKTYKAEGTITSDIDTGGMEMKIATSFSILLKKPNLYLISWTQKNMPMPSMVQSGTVWSNGTQPYLYKGMMNAYSKMTSDEIALGSATGISGGAAFTIPSLFLSVFKEQPAPFSRLKDPKIEKTEKVGEEDCYVLSGPSVISKKETFWISKTSYLIRKYYRSLEPPEEGIVIPEMTDEQLEEVIKGMGQKVTEESKRNMREMIERSRTMLKTVKMKGSSTELHVNITTPKLAKEDFEFKLPAGAVQKESIFGNVLGGKNETREETSLVNTRLADRLISADDKIRKEAILEYKTLTRKAKQQQVDFLMRTLADKNSKHRVYAAFSLGQMGFYAQKSIPLLIKTLEAKDNNLYWVVINSLGDFGPSAKEAAPALRRFLKSKDKYERASAAIALVAIGEASSSIKDVVTTLTSALSYNDTWTRQEAINMIGELGAVAKDALSDLIRITRKGDPVHSRYSVWALGRVATNERDVVPVLIESLNHENLNVRLNALMSLEILNPEAKETDPRVMKEFKRFKELNAFSSALVYCASIPDPCPAELDVKEVQLLLKMGGKVNYKDYLTGKTALMHAAEKGQIAIARELINQGADVKMVSDNTGIKYSFMAQLIPRSKYEGKSALIYAVEAEIPKEKKLELVELLVKNGADVNMAGKNSFTPLKVAQNLREQEVAAFLIAHGATANAK